MRKAGVGISGDSQKLMRDYGVACGGLVDLADMANDRLEPGLVQRWSLAGMYAVCSLSWVGKRFRHRQVHSRLRETHREGVTGPILSVCDGLFCSIGPAMRCPDRKTRDDVQHRNH